MNLMSSTAKAAAAQAPLASHTPERFAHDCLHRILADLIDKPDRLSAGLKHIDRFVQIEGAFREQDRARFGPSLEAF